jgi:inorganic triphosphatase YgiF
MPLDSELSDPEQSPQNPHQEIEVKLAAEDPTVLEELLGRRELGGCALRRAATRWLSDRHYDTSDHALGEAGMALRWRVQDGVELLTLKGRSEVQGALFQRGELEVSADAAGWNTVLGQLARSGVRLAAGATGASPAAWLASAGLVLTQYRTTVRKVLTAQRDGVSVAEIALDTVTYHFGRYEVLFREIEIEALSGDASLVLALGAAIQAAYPGRVAPSERGKYSRGLELATRLG